MMYARQRGLTLVELMIVVAVMAIIATVAYPLYTAQVQKSRRADAKVAVEMVAMAQERFYTINGSYAAILSTLQVSPEIQGGASTEGYYTIANPVLSGGGQGFTVTATRSASGAQQNDGCVSFAINHAGAKTSNPATGCW